MDPNYSDSGVVFEDDAMRHTINTSYYDNIPSSESKSKFAIWMMKKFPFIKNENSANIVMILFSVIIFIISLSLFFGGDKKPEVSKINQTDIDRMNESAKIVR